MRISCVYRKAFEKCRSHFIRFYAETLAFLILRIPFFGCMFALFADVTVKKHEDLTRAVFFMAALLIWLFVMMPSRFRYAEKVREKLTDTDRSGSYRRNLRLGIGRTIAGAPSLLFACACAVLWWGKNISPINDFNKRVRNLGAFFVGEGATAQEKGYAGITTFIMIMLFCALIAFFSWQMSYGAEYRKNGMKRFYRGIRAKSRKCAGINAAAALISVLPILIAAAAYVTDTLRDAGTGAASRALTLISLLGTVPPSRILIAAAADLLILWIPLRMLRSTVCALCIMEEDGEKINET